MTFYDPAMSGKSIKDKEGFLSLSDASALQAYLGYTLEIIYSSSDKVPISM